jgi:hypothetical protein
MNRWFHWSALAAALFLLNSSLTFGNVWPTPGVRWQGELSIELAACVCLLALASFTRGTTASRRALRWLAVLWVLLAIGRYADVTAPALYGRDVNLFWDLRHVSNVVAMLARVASWSLIVLATAGAVFAVALLYGVARWALGRLAAAVARPIERRVLASVATAALIVFAVQRLSGAFPSTPTFAKPVTETYARQALLVLDAMTAGGKSAAIPPSPSLASDLTMVKGADVVLMFMESYGAVSFDRPEFADRLAGSRLALEEAIDTSRREVVSAFVESPTFGGSSWLAHLSLMSGVEVRDPDTYALLMAQKRDTLVTTFARHGYRTVAVMPGLHQSWPEGSFYGFHDIYGGTRLEYRGPSFGWWDIPDQFALAKLGALEFSRQPRTPVFAFFPTLSTHTPFTPTPPYQPDWRRVLTDRPYDAAVLDIAYLWVPDWLNLGPGYVNAVAYTYTVISGYLRAQPDHDLVLILIGDHQPPAMVTGEGAPWDVPVHVIASRTDVLERLVGQGFRPGLVPGRPVLGRMHTLGPMLLDAFGERD